MDTDSGQPTVGIREQLRRLRRMFAYLGNVKFHVAVTTTILIAYVTADVYTVSRIKPAIDVISDVSRNPDLRPAASVWDWLLAPDGSGAALRRALLILAAAKIALSILAWARTISQTWQSMSMVFFMRAAVYDRLQRVGFAFHDHHSAGQLINRALNDLQAVRSFVLVSLQYSIDISCSLVLYLGLIFMTSPLMACAAVLPLPIWLWALRRYAIKTQPVYEKQVQAGDEMVRLLTENIAGVHVVRAFATEEIEKKKFKAACDNVLARLLEGVAIRQIFTPLIRAIAIFTTIGLWALGAVLVQKQKLAVSDLIIFSIAMNNILSKVQQINVIADAYQQAVVSSKRLFDLLDEPDTTPDRPEAEPLRPGGGAVEFSNVTFGYDSEQPVLHEVSFKAPAGTTVALVGPTGGGKTTLAALLGRFYDADKGSIKIDGHDVRDVTLQSVRDGVGYVFQETFLFSDTIARNIAYGDLNAPAEQIRQAARIARAEEFIERLPEKYNTMLGEFGASLSGGQRQRIAIARAILHNPRILVLDDALASVDPETEALIRLGLEKIMEGRTVFLITSRISTARQADIIFVLENGRITQRGTHAELMDQPGYYRDVASAQFSGDVRSQQLLSHMDRMGQLARTSGRQRAQHGV